MGNDKSRKHMFHFSPEVETIARLFSGGAVTTSLLAKMLEMFDADGDFRGADDSNDVWLAAHAQLRDVVGQVAYDQWWEDAIKTD